MKHRLAAMLALLAGTSAHAQEGVTAVLDPVLVSAPRVPTRLRETSDSVTVITADQIERMGAASGPDLLRQVPGLQVDQLGGPGGLSSVYIRGSDSNHVLVLIDGVRVNDSTNSRGGGFDMSSLDPANIERIEVLRGAASALYGAEAMGGVINIVTRQAAEGGRGSLGLGGQHWREASAQIGLGAEGRRFSLAASDHEDGSDADGGRLKLSQFSAAGRIKLCSCATLDLDARHGERRSSAFPDDSGGIRLAEIRTLEQKRGSDTSLAARGSWVHQAMTLNFAVSNHLHVEDIDSPGVAPGLRSDFGVPSAVSHTDFRRSNASLSALWRASPEVELAFGGEWQREQGGNHTLYSFFGMPIPVDFELQRDTRSLFGEGRWQPLKELSLRLGLRHDSVEGQGSRDSPTLGLRYELASRTSLKASYSTGFKPPSFFALGLPVALGGNPGLRAERSKGGSLGIEQNLLGDDRLRFEAALFKTRYTDLVTFDNETNQTVNANQVEIRGAELQLDAKFSPTLQLGAHFTRLISHVADSNEPLRQRPGRRAGLQLSWAPQDGTQLQWRSEYVADVFDSSIPTGNLTLPSWLRCDFVYTQRWATRWRTQLAVDNVFDKRLEAYVGATAPGRRLRLLLQLDL